MDLQNTKEKWQEIGVYTYIIFFIWLLSNVSILSTFISNGITEPKVWFSAILNNFNLLFVSRIVAKVKQTFGVDKVSEVNKSKNPLDKL